MSETEKDVTLEPQAATDDRSFAEYLKALVGKVVTIVNPESYEDAPIGHQIRASFYRAKVTGMGSDYLKVQTEYVHKSKEKEPVKQFIPLDKIKRISMMKEERILHL